MNRTNKYNEKPHQLDNIEKVYLHAINTGKEYNLINESALDEYYFIYFIRNEKTGELQYTIMIEQSKEYINSQLQEVSAFYAASVIVISFRQIAFSYSSLSNPPRS